MNSKDMIDFIFKKVVNINEKIKEQNIYTTFYDLWELEKKIRDYRNYIGHVGEDKNL